ncbi:MAG: flagellar motor protein MotB [Geobacter sp.]|nr:MAG: flagellar motor protein MotB [Geobacter sp.]
MTRFVSAVLGKRTGIVILLSLLVAGCGPSQSDMMAKDRLEQAREVYDSAKSNENVQVYAPVPLIEAEKAMSLAEQAKDPAEIEHLSCLAKQRSLIAVAIAEGKVAENDTRLLDKESAEILLMKRERETKMAMSRANATAAELEKIRLESEIKTRELDRLKREAEARANEAQNSAKLAEKLLKELSELKARQTDRGIVLTIGDVLFATGKAEIRSNAQRSIDKLAAFLTSQPNRNVVIEGYTDSVGSDKYNLDLSEKRAESAKNELVARGIDGGRITTRGFGKRDPVASNDTPEGRQLNRRVEVIILNEVAKPEGESP